MRINNYKNIFFAVVILGLVVVSPFRSVAANGWHSNVVTFELNAKIMSIDIVNGTILVAEKTVNLSSYYEKGVRKFSTQVVNKMGTEILLVNLKKGDRVVIEGAEDGDSLIADKITLVKSR